MKNQKQALVIGAGPAGLMAADTLAQAGLMVTLAEAKPSVGRKFLMAGKSGLNVTKDESLETFADQYSGLPEILRPALDAFGSDAVKAWVKSLGIDIFTGSTGRIFPVMMKASPLLRNWLLQLSERGVLLKTRWRWIGWREEALIFDTPQGMQEQAPDVTVFALGGASWARLGSDGQWTKPFLDRSVETRRFIPSNVGLLINWSQHMEKFYGEPLKAVALSCGELSIRGEAVISAKGLEGSGIYSLNRALRRNPNLFIDLMPDWSHDRIRTALDKSKGKSTLGAKLRKSLGLPTQKRALLQEFGRPLPNHSDALAKVIKSLPISHLGPRPMDEAISTAGGIGDDQLERTLMLRHLPGHFCAGEMLDWDAPTGGYLITGALATGRWAGKNAAQYALSQSP